MPAVAGSGGEACLPPRAAAVWSFTDNRIAVRFEYEYHDAAGQWFRAYGVELWEFAPDGRMRERHASINDVPIRAEERRNL